MLVGKICILFQAECAFGFFFACWQKTCEDFITVMKLAVLLCALPCNTRETPAPLKSNLKLIISPDAGR